MEVLQISPKTTEVILAFTRSPILSDEAAQIIKVVACVFISAIIGLLGVVANIINIIIFYKQGFTSTVNMSFFSMAISDLLCLIFLEWGCICLNPLLQYNPDISFESRDVSYLTAAIPYVCFSRITGWITAFVTIERCLSVTVPLKVKRIITPRRTVIALCSMYLVNMLAFTPEYLISYLGWKFDENKNKTLIGHVYKVTTGVEGRLMFVFYPILSMTSFVLVIVFTIVLVVKLREKSAWRQSATSDKTQTGTLSTRDANTVKMVIVIACILIICYTPGTIAAAGTIFEPQLSLNGDYENLYNVAWSFAYVFQAFNSSVNIIFYYRMSSNYRQTFLQLCPCCSNKKS